MKFVVSTVLLVIIFFASDIIKSGETLKSSNKNLSHKVNKDIGSYVAGGERITTERYPYNCQIIWSDTYRCQGALINKYWVIGYCWDNFVEHKITIYFGEWNSTWGMRDFKNLYDIPYSDIFVHPFNGLLNLYKLQKEAPVSSTAIALPKRDLLATSMEHIEVLLLYTNEVYHCVTNSYKRCFNEVTNEESVFCLSCHENFTSTNDCDRGMIIVYRDKDADSTHILFGLKYYYSQLYFTNVAYHLDWINAVTGIHIN